jgi:hypothetical protein
MKRLLPALVALLLASPAPAQELPTWDKPPLPRAEPLDEPAFVSLEKADLIGTWHGIEPSDAGFNSWEVDYRNDGTYQVRVVTREFEIEGETEATSDEISDGTWKITGQGFLDFDDGEMLFKPVARDEQKIVYTCSFPKEQDVKPWTVHEFRGEAPPVIFDLAPFTPRKETVVTPEQTQLINLRQLLLGCSAYAVEHGGQFPAKLSLLEPNFGADVLADLRMFTNPMNDIQTPWKVVPGRNITDPHDSMLMHSPSYGDGKRIVGFIDGSAMIVPEEEFAEKLGKKNE